MVTLALQTGGYAMPDRNARVIVAYGHSARFYRNRVKAGAVLEAEGGPVAEAPLPSHRSARCWRKTPHATTTRRALPATRPGI